MFGHLQQALVVPGESVGGGPIGGVAGLALKAGEEKEGWCFDSGSSGHVTYDSAKMTNYRPCNKFVSVASGKQLPIEGHGNLVVDFQSGQDFVRIELLNVAYVPSLGYHLLSIPSCIGDGHTFVFDTKGVTVHLKSGQELLVPPVGKMYFGYGQ